MMDKEVSKNELTLFKLKKIELINNIGIYERFVNWVIGEFDLFLKNESKKLEVYFPNGQFYIGNFEDDKNELNIKILVEGKSSLVCKKIMLQLENIYQHVLLFNKNKTNDNNS
ncbi:hypothetical protein JL193_16545 [Polaribacter batillariae]|uniref:Uncharacterized protein n=1 Tax=Polaribacter batillariae TaxID=2808900 RepID=A0ABX7STS6_9FLAO|nr:hypothetical protein [Polaribacter batillariae]QTD37652.1 hypothetical protein JL193_16545 [Polaribacter batillariae]